MRSGNCLHSIDLCCKHRGKWRQMGIDRRYRTGRELVGQDVDADLAEGKRLGEEEMGLSIPEIVGNSDSGSLD